MDENTLNKNVNAIFNERSFVNILAASNSSDDKPLEKTISKCSDRNIPQKSAINAMIANIVKNSEFNLLIAFTFDCVLYRA